MAAITPFPASPRQAGVSSPAQGGSGKGDPTDVEPEFADKISGFVYRTWLEYRDHDSTRAFRQQCLDNLRSYRGEYSSAKLTDIRRFGGSEVYSHLVSVKCRGATALLREVFLGTEKIWDLKPTPAPDLPEQVKDAVAKLIEIEVAGAMQSGQRPPQEAIAARAAELTEAVSDAQDKEARAQAKIAGTKIQDLLVEGGFYQALVDFITDLPIFLFACLKGPEVRMVEDLRWEGGKLVLKRFPRMFWERVSPMDLWFTPGAARIEDASTLEHIKLSRADLNMLIGLPGYREDAIRGVLNDYTGGYVQSWIDDSTRAKYEGREDPYLNRSQLLDGMAFNGQMHGQMLLDYGFKPSQIPDADLDYFVTAWVIGRHTIKVQINPNPRKRVPYYLTSFEKVPGSITGLGLPNILSDVEDVANSSLRSLVNNMSIASGPMVGVNEERLSPTSDATKLYPWKIIRFLDDPLSNNNLPPINFFQPNSNAQELLAVYQAMTKIADETSSIPRYLTGNESVGGAGRTASGLSMLMGSASKMIQVVASNIDRDVMHPALQALYDFIMLTDQGQTLRGDENITVMGVQVAAQKELERNRQLEFLNMTSNPTDMQIMGMNGRASLLRKVGEGLGIPVDDVIPTEKDLMKIEQAQREQQAVQQRQEMLAQGQPQSQPGRSAGPPAQAPVAAMDLPQDPGQQQRRTQGVGGAPGAPGRSG